MAHAPTLNGVKIVNRANLSAEAVARLEAALPPASTLLELLSNVQGRSLEVVAVVTQDEFTHDVVIAWSEGLSLVYGAT